MIAKVIVTLSWAALGFAMAAGVLAAFGALLHLFALASGLLRGFRHDDAADDRRQATHLLAAAGICALVAAAVGGIVLLIASFQ
ncbi:hypothetical protein [Variovorax sp.]|jgi:hypothetical protein|uniref:hypothetical protein n=1 Tax=Variovorax sp. TaxID=1871043 RepID=UPI0037D9CA6F